MYVRKQKPILFFEKEEITENESNTVQLRISVKQRGEILYATHITNLNIMNGGYVDALFRAFLDLGVFTAVQW